MTINEIDLFQQSALCQFKVISMIFDKCDEKTICSILKWKRYSKFYIHSLFCYENLMQIVDWKTQANNDKKQITSFTIRLTSYIVVMYVVKLFVSCV